RDPHAELTEEIEWHRAMRQEQFERSGMTPDDARAASKRTLGNVALAREDARAVWTWAWLDHLRQDSLYALRSVKRSPGFAAALIVVTPLGLGATTGGVGFVKWFGVPP